MEDKSDIKFKQILALTIIGVCLLSCILPAFISHMSEDTAFGLSLLKETSFVWVTGILGYYYGSKFIKFFLNMKSKD